jgi:hypothetical protein
LLWVRNPFARLVLCKRVALDCARAELGMSGGKVPHHSREARRLLARLAQDQFWICSFWEHAQTHQQRCCWTWSQHLPRTSSLLKEQMPGWRTEAPLGWAPVQLLLPAGTRLSFWTIGGQVAYHHAGRAARAGQHVGTLKQSRWGWLSAAYDAEDLCAALPAWMVDRDRGVPSAQF